MGKKLEAFFENRIWNKITCFLFPAVLVIFSLLHIGEGITVTDTGYNYGNFVYFNSLDDMWKFSTYLSSAIGAFFTNLPYGQTMVGLNFYTGLFKVIAVLAGYYFCIRVCKMKKEAVFLGELIAVGLCWCPTALIYNYLTYLFFTVGAIFLYMAIVKEKSIYYVIAGIVLGLNVFVRLPNVAETALIAVVWLVGILYKSGFGKIVKDTLLCIAGYVIGLVSVFAYIALRYGPARYINGIKALFAMTEEAESYTVKAMIVDMIRVYLEHFKWFACTVVVLFLGMILFEVFDKKFEKIKTAVYIVVVLFEIFLLKRAGMYDFDYRNYESMFAFGVLFLMFCLLLGAVLILFTKRKKEEKVLAAIVCVIIFITPLGSNNHLYSPINNLFLAAPFLVNYIWELLSDEKRSIMIGKIYFSIIPYKTVLVLFAGAILIQSVLFGANFVFRDGLSGESRNYEIENNSVLKGMKTTEKNAVNLQELNDFLAQSGGIGKEAILFGNVPALSFYYELEPALSSTWPDLASFSYEKFEAELGALKEDGRKPLVIISADPYEVGADENSGEILQNKWQCLNDFLENYSYEQTFKNDAFVVYMVQK
ncbi:MAG: hypothetical protein IKJ15_02595 [Lachnospiraceae bacterium]|nr:hypothetical protein [Lachnospiraceae bacterium]